jgi:choline dehydrogenase-like flavoprotein
MNDSSASRNRLDSFDYVVVGAGSAGCVIANRLSADPRIRVLLLEAGADDSHPYVGIPKGIAKLRLHPALSWCLPVEPELGRSEVWPRGKMIGGTSSLNGMFYVRGQPQDYDDWERLGNQGWGWKHMAECFKSLEDHELGADDLRGVGGPLHISLPYRSPSNPLDEAIIEAGAQMGLPRRADLNGLDQLGVGYYPLTVWRGRRWSSANAFLDPARRRPNLTVLTGAHVDRILVESRRAIGIACRVRGTPRRFFARRDVILCAGTLKSPQLLQLSGIGPAALLESAGISVVHDNPAVGANMREHLSMTVIHELRGVRGENCEYRGAHLAKNVMRYYAFHDGPLSTSTFSIGGFAKTGLEGDRPDIQWFMAPLSWDTSSAKSVVSRVKTAKEPGITCFAYFLHPESRGTVTIRSADPDAPPIIRPNWLATENDRRAAVAVAHFMRGLMSQPALAPYLGRELTPGAGVRTDEELLQCYAKFGSTANHAVGTCAMGSVVDDHLRVLGIEGLRVADISVIPQAMSGNTNAPAIAIGWRLAAIMTTERQSDRPVAAAAGR